MNVNSSKWTRALWEPAAGVRASKVCVTLSDLQGIGDFQLVLVDESSLPNRLKLFKGLKPLVESVLSDCPAGIVGFACDVGNSESTCLAVACGSSLLIYRNMKPYYRYNVPQRDILPTEMELWSQLSKAQIRKELLIEGLKLLQQEHSLGALSHQSQQLLTLCEEEAAEDVGREQQGNAGKEIAADDKEQRQNAFIDFVLFGEKGAPAPPREGDGPPSSIGAAAADPPSLTNLQITCIATIPRNQSQTSAVDVLLLGTERGSLYFVDSQAYTVLRKDVIAAVPVKILPTGYYDLEYRIVVCTRGHDVFVLRKNGKGEHSTNSFYLREHPFDAVFCSSQFVFATRRRRLVFYSQKCRRQNSIQFQEDIVDLEQFYYEPKQYEGVLVALGNEIHLYIDQLRVDTIRMDRPVEWIRFGRMGREEGVLVFGTQGGGLCVKIFRRVATFDDGARSGALLTAQQRRSTRAGAQIELPKKSRTFVDQSLRERENPKLLHQIYQRNWFIVKWHTAKMFAALETGGKGGELAAVAGEVEPVQVQYELLGFGPHFRLQIRVLCSAELDSVERWIVFLFDEREFSFRDRMIPVPRLLPNRATNFCTQIRCLHPEKQQQFTDEDPECEVRMLLCRKDRSRPVWAATFQMPASELPID